VENLEILLCSFSPSRDSLSESLSVAVGRGSCSEQADWAYSIYYREEHELWKAQIEAVRILLEAGADPNYIDRFNRSTLSETARTAEGAESIRLLLNYGAHIDVEGPYHPFIQAVYNGNTEVVKEFLHRTTSISPVEPENSMKPHSASYCGYVCSIGYCEDPSGRKP
jgi:FOG: Ankyrin repeat